MAKATEPRSNVVVAREAFVGEIRGEIFRVLKGDLFEADHPAVKKWPHLFGPVVFRFPVARTLTAPELRGE